MHFSEWFANEVAPDGVAEDGCHPDEAKALEDYCYGKTDVEKAAQAITQHVRDPENCDESCGLWGLLRHALVERPATELPALIKLLAAVEKVYEWRNHSVFIGMWADSYMQGTWRDGLPSMESAERVELRAEHVRKATVEACLVLTGVGQFPLDWGYWCIADALENSDAVLDFEVPAAAEWIAIAGKDIYAGAVRGEESWSLTLKRDLAEPAKTMSVERWSFWVTRMKEMIKQPKPVRNAAKAAVGTMEALMSDSHHKDQSLAGTNKARNSVVQERGSKRPYILAPTLSL